MRVQGWQTGREGVSLTGTLWPWQQLTIHLVVYSDRSVLPTVLGARDPKLRSGPDWFLLEAPGQNLGLSQLLLVLAVLGVPWLVDPPLLPLPRLSHSCPPSACVQMSLFL